MELHEYPRPADDTGIGIHWSASFPVAVGLGKIRDFWVPEMKAMGIKWVKIAVHDGALPLVELLLEQGFMPIVRIYRPKPNPGHLSSKELAAVEDLIRAGVSYFEFNNEPDLGLEWEGGQVPPNALDIVAENAIIDMEAILERGGMPGVPAVSTGTRWDIVGKIVEKGRADLFHGPVWQAVHNYSVNHPLDYPYDAGNQEGAPYTREFYEALRQEQWEGDAWSGRSLEEVNRLRQEHSNPGATIMDDASCWLAYERFDALVRQHIGRSIPILATEDGYLVGEAADPRYPATTPNLHMAQTLEACRVLMGTSKRFPPAPNYFFCSAFWLMANFELGSPSSWWEGHAWYSSRWPGGKLPIVDALKAEPKVPRAWQETPVQKAVIQGVVLHPDGPRTVLLKRKGPGEEFQELARTELDDQGRFRFPEVAPGRYQVAILETPLQQEVQVAPGQRMVHLTFDLAAPSPEEPRESILQGQVRGGAQATLLLVRQQDGESLQTVAREDGSFRFLNLPPGDYTASVQEPPGSRQAGITLDGREEKRVELAVFGWGYTIRDGGESPGFGIIRCSVEGHKGLEVKARTEGWESNPVTTGSKAEYGEFACEIAPLGAGNYVVEVLGLKDDQGQPLTLEAPVRVELDRVAFVEFVFTEPSPEEASHSSRIFGRVVNGAGLTVALMDKQPQRWEQTVGPDEGFQFQDLGPGIYTLEVVGWEELTRHPRITLDGSNQVEVNLVVPSPEEPAPSQGKHAISVITGVAPGTAGKTAVLVEAQGGRLEQEVGRHDRFTFRNLPPGIYTLSVAETYLQENLVVDGLQGWEVIFPPVEAEWVAEVRPAGRGPGFSVVRAEVLGRMDWPVRIYTEGWAGITQRTGSKQEYGEFALEFSPLGPGRYVVEPEGMDVKAEVELTGREVLMVTFRRSGVASGPTVVRPLPPEGTKPEKPMPSPAPAPTPSPQPPRYEHAILLAAPPADMAELQALLQYAEAFQPHVAANQEEALEARHVTLLGFSPEEAQPLQDRLRLAGISFDQVSPPLAPELRRRVQARRPW